MQLICMTAVVRYDDSGNTLLQSPQILTYSTTYRTYSTTYADNMLTY